MISLLADPVQHRHAGAHRQAVDREAQVVERAGALVTEGHLGLSGCARPLRTIAARLRDYDARRLPQPAKGVIACGSALNVGYWGLGLTARGPARARARGRATRLRLRVGGRGLRLGRGDGARRGSPAQTERIKLGSAIFQMPARSPAMTAMTAATLDQLSDGRMLLGIGSSGPQVAEGWHGAALRPPAAAHARVRRRSCAWPSAASGVEYHGETIRRCRCPTARARR